jgi:hypothetical protein
MKHTIKITIQNKMLLEKRAMSVYHHATRSAHMISHNSSITLPLQTFADDDYMYISIVSGPGNLEHKSIVDLPAWANFELLSEGQLKVLHKDERTLLRIPAGLPEWKLKLYRSAAAVTQTTDRVIIEEDRLEDA